MATITILDAPVSVELARKFIAAVADSTTYTVVAGDTGTVIAGKLHVTFAQLDAANPGVNWNALRIGQTLQVPGHSVAVKIYTVVSGDSLSAIAAKSGLSLASLIDLNPQLCKIGDKINVPGNGGDGDGGDDPGTNGDPTVRSYSGPASSFPDPSQWQKFSLMWQQNLPAMQINDTADQISFMKQAITTLAAESGIDKRVILGTIMQESSGNVHIRTTISPDGIRNPGLMQSHNGAEFSDNDPQGSILQMVSDGTEGTAFGDGLKQCFAHQGNIYAAMREYNSGSVDVTNLSNGLGATPSYVSDIANRLMGALPN